MTTIRTKKLKRGEIIPLTYDFIFADIFNREENIGVLEYFLSFYLNIPYEKIKGNLKINHRRQPLDHKLEANREVDLIKLWKKENKYRNIQWICIREYRSKYRILMWNSWKTIKIWRSRLPN